MPDTDDASNRGGGAAPAGEPSAVLPPTPRDGSAGPSRTEPAPRRRFVISQRLAGYGDERTRRDMVDVFNARFERVLLPHVDVLSDSGSAAAGLRRVVVLEADAAELAAKLRDLTLDAIIEPEMPRGPCLFSPTSDFTPFLADGGPGTGGSLRLAVLQNEGPPMPGVKVLVKFTGRSDASKSTEAGAYTDADGFASIAFDPNLWIPALAVVDAGSRFWDRLIQAPQNGLTVRLDPLPTGGPFSWWQYLTGAVAYDVAAGNGISVGVIDTGVGPHPCLDHVAVLGSQLDGVFVAGAEAGRDIQGHGTHVAGLIAARPIAAGGYGGVAPGVDLSAIRVFAPNRNTSQADIIAAVDRMSIERGADLVNLSLGGEAPSDLERDAFISALRVGTLCIAAAGNGNGAPVVYPAAYPECAAVSALGLLNTYPADSLAAANLPTDFGGWGVGGLFSPAFTNKGPGLACAAPGNAIISTVPAAAGEAAYAVMSGTSMAAPLATAALAVSLSRDPAYQRLPRSIERSTHAYNALLVNAVSVGLQRQDVGFGMGRGGGR